MTLILFAANKDIHKKIRTMMWCVSFNLGFAEPYDVSSPSSIFGQKGFGWIVASITHLNRPPMDRLHRACQRQRRPQKGLPCLETDTEILEGVA